MTAHKIVTSVELGPGKTNVSKVEENKFIAFGNMVVFDYVKGIFEEGIMTLNIKGERYCFSGKKKKKRSIRKKG